MVFCLHTSLSAIRTEYKTLYSICVSGLSAGLSHALKCTAEHVSVGLLVSPGLLFLVVFVMLYIGSSRGHDCRRVHIISFLVTRRNM